MALAIVLILVAVGSVLFHIYTPWWWAPIASNWGGVDDTIVLTFWITGAAFVAIVFFIAYSVIRYRYHKGRRAHYQPHNKKLEWWLSGLTTVGVIAMLAPGLVVYSDLIHPPADASLVEALGQQWQWRFRYPGEDGKLGVTDVKFVSAENPFGLNPNDPNGKDDVLVDGQEMHLPLDRPIKMLLRSKDVLHDYYVPQFRVKMDIVPGMVSYFWLTPTRTGKFEIVCSEYCGVGHYNMRGTVVVEEEASFQAWLKAQPTFAGAPAAKAAATAVDLPTQGKQLAQSRGCLACHSVDGSASVGPTWKGLYGKTETLVDGKTVVVGDEYLAESVRNPNAKVVKGFAPIMPPAQFSDQEMAALIQFIKAGDAGKK
jgi:cytochrome c oxidase subunit 2